MKDGGVKSKIIKRYLPLMNQQINKYLQLMDFYINFSLDEEFKESIKSPVHEDFSYESFSEGEKMRIDLSLLFTWRDIAKMKNSVSTNLLILDEIFDSSLDGFGTDYFTRIIKYVVTDANVFVISHKTDELVDKFDNILKFDKIKNTLVEPYLPNHQIGIVHFAGKNNDEIRNNKNFISKIETTDGEFIEKKLRFNK